MERDYKIDIIRISALLLVIFLHYWSYQGFNSDTVVGLNMFIKCFFRNGALICVPLFMTISGFLCGNKKYIPGYIRGLKKTIIIYMICSFIIFFSEIVYNHGEIDIVNKFLRLVAFRGSEYAWYVEMYIGLFLLIPFLNVIWNNVERKYIMIAALSLTIIPQSVNIFALTSHNMIFITDTYNKLFPEYWINLYPITYYFLGRYIAGLKNIDIFFQEN